MPGRPRSVGFGPIFVAGDERLLLRGTRRRRSRPGSGRARRPRPAARAGPDADRPAPRRRAGPAAGAGTSCPCSRTARAAASPRRCQTAARTRCPPGPRGHSTRGRPPFGFGGSASSSGSTAAHNPSLTRGLMTPQRTRGGFCYSLLAPSPAGVRCGISLGREPGSAAAPASASGPDGRPGPPAPRGGAPRTPPRPARPSAAAARPAVGRRGPNHRFGVISPSRVIVQTDPPGVCVACHARPLARRPAPTTPVISPARRAPPPGTGTSPRAGSTASGEPGALRRGANGSEVPGRACASRMAPGARSSIGRPGSGSPTPPRGAT